jgi:hypothetical protein
MSEEKITHQNFKTVNAVYLLLIEILEILEG